MEACRNKIDVQIVNEDYTSKHCSVCENVIDKSKDVSRILTLEDGNRKEHRLRKCTFCLDSQRPSLFERGVGSFNFIQKRGTQFMRETWHARTKSFINRILPSLWSTSLKTT